MTAGVTWALLRREDGGRATYNELWSAVRDFREGNILRYPVISPEGLLQPLRLPSPAAFHPLFSPIVSLNFPPSLKEDQGLARARAYARVRAIQSFLSLRCGAS